MNRSVTGGAATGPDVGRQIRLLREQRDLSQQALAEASGISRNTLSLLECGRSSPTLTTLQKIAAALQVDLNFFFPADAASSSPGVTESAAAEPDCRIERLMAAHILRLPPGEQRYLLEPGDSLHIDGRLPRCCQNLSQEKAEALVILLDIAY